MSEVNSSDNDMTMSDDIANDHWLMMMIEFAPIAIELSLAHCYSV